MKLIPVAFILIFTIKVIASESDDNSSESHNLHNAEVNVNTSQPSPHSKILNKARKYVVSLTKPKKSSFNLPKRGHRNISKFKIQEKVTKNPFPVLSTKRPKLMEGKKFTSKPHAIDRMDVHIERSNFHKKRVQSKFNKFGTEEKDKITEKNYYESKTSEHLDNRFQNFTDIDISIENDSDESNETEKPLRRRYMKTAASDKVKAIASPPFVNVNTQRNYKIKDLLKNQKYNPRMDRKLVPVLALQKGSGALVGGQDDTKNKAVSSLNSASSEDNGDQKEFIFIKEDKRKSTTAGPENEEIMTVDPIIFI